MDEDELEEFVGRLKSNDETLTRVNLFHLLDLIFSPLMIMTPTKSTKARTGTLTLPISPEQSRTILTLPN